MIKPGVKVLIFAFKGQDGGLHAMGVIGENGAAPPL